jgi:tetratricopeptide (TPR) repeat protein
MGSIGRVLRERRLSLGLSQEALAEAAGVSARSVNRWEQDAALPQPSARLRLAAALALDLADLSPHSASIDEPGTDAIAPLAWHVPPRRNPFFTGRDALLEQLRTALLPSGPAPRIQALTGLPGMGKTQTALEYAYRYAQCYRAVFWIGAGSLAGCRAEFGQLAGILDLPVGSQHRLDRSLAVVKEWFRRNPGWLVVLDDVDDWRVLDELGLSGSGAVLVTTRAQAIGAAGGRFEVTSLSTDDSVEFLLRRGRIASSPAEPEMASSPESAAARALVERLGRMPLALDQAGAYLEETGCSVETYLQRFNVQHYALLARRGRLAVEHPDSVAATLTLAYQHMSRGNPVAAELLCLCAFLHPDLIPEEVLAAGPDALGPTLGPAVTDPLRFDEALADLASLSLVLRDRRTHALGVHRLVQEVVRFALSPEDQRLWASRAVSSIAQTLPEGDPYHFGPFLRLLPQAMVAVELVQRWDMQTIEAAGVMEELGAHYQLAGDYAESRRLLVQALRLRKQLQGSSHIDTAATRMHLAELSLALGHYTRAETLARAALHSQQAQLPPTDARVAHAMSLLGRICTERGRYAVAEALVRQALDLQTSSLGEQHPLVAETLGLLAEVAFMRGRYPETEKLLQRALTIKEVVLGPKHLVTGLSVEALGTLYRYWGRDAEAETHFRRALPILVRLLGSDHPMIMTVLNGLARAKLGQGQLPAAERLARRALHVREAVLGPDHPKLAYSLQALCEILLAQDRVREAEPLARRGLAIRDRVHGERHPTVSISLDILGQIRERMGDPVEAEALYRRALTILSDTAGPAHPRMRELQSRYDNLRLSAI